MSLIKQVNVRLTIATLLLWLAIVAIVSSCGNSHDTSTGSVQRSASRIDTAGINAEFRKQNNLPIGAPQKEAGLRNVLGQAIREGYNDRACYLLMDFASHHIEKG